MDDPMVNKQDSGKEPSLKDGGIGHNEHSEVNIGEHWTDVQTVMESEHHPHDDAETEMKYDLPSLEIDQGLDYVSNDESDGLYESDHDENRCGTPIPYVEEENWDVEVEKDHPFADDGETGPVLYEKKYFIPGDTYFCPSDQHVTSVGKRNMQYCIVEGQFDDA